MKSPAIILSVLALLLSGIALYKQFSGNKSERMVNAAAAGDGAGNGPAFSMAYFDIDSLQNNYTFYKEALGQLKTREEAVNNELAGLEKSYQKKIAEWQKRGANMSQAEAEAAQREYQQMQQNFQQRRVSLEQQLENQKMEYKKSIKEKIEAFLKEYNKTRNYTYIISYEPELMFYKDSAHNITGDLIKGLNEAYQKK